MQVSNSDSLVAVAGADAAHQAGLLRRRGAHHDEHASAGAQRALEPRLIDRQRCGQHDHVVARLLGQLHGVGVDDLDRHAGRRRLQVGAREVGDLGMQLEAAHPAAELGQAGRQVARAGADLEHLLAAAQRQRPAGCRPTSIGRSMCLPHGRAISQSANASSRQRSRHEALPRHARAGCRVCARRARPRRAPAARPSARGRLRISIGLNPRLAAEARR